MKKLFLVLAIAASLQAFDAQAQVKSAAAAKAAVEKAEATTQNPKQSTKPATWIKYGDALLEAYDAPIGNVWIGMGRQEFDVLGAAERPSSEETVNLNGRQMTKLVCETKNLYFNENGQLEIIEVTVPVYEDALDRALAAFSEAAKVDTKGQKSKDIAAGLTNISKKYTDEAYNRYSLGDYNGSSVFFEKSAEASAMAPLSQLDTNSIYNAGFTAFTAGNYDRAKTFYEKCLENKYYGEGGEVFSRLAEIADKAGDKAKSKDYLEQGFAIFPQSQSILVGLINYYVTNNEDTDRLFELLDEAKKNEPDNASLYYVEGNIHVQLGDGEAGLAAYSKCSEIDPNYAYGYIGTGVYYYDLAVKLQNEASEEMDDAKYTALMGEFETALKSCIPPFEKAFELSTDPEIKSTIAEYLKNACFRFRTSGAEYQEKYDKYANYNPAN